MRKILVLFAFTSFATVSVGEEIVFVASLDEAMPLAGFRDEKLSEGILKDIGEAIAIKIGANARFVTLPRKRSESALVSGTVDGVCYARPEWTDIKLNWSKPFILNGDMLVASPGVPMPENLTGMKGKTIGTILGYQYPELEAEIGKDYIRDDAPSMHTAINKILISRTPYSIVDKIIFSYEAKLRPALKSLPTLMVTNFAARCGFSPASSIPFERVNTAINQLVKDGTMDRIVQSYK